MRTSNVADVAYDAICDRCGFMCDEKTYVRLVECAGMSCVCGSDSWHFERDDGTPLLRDTGDPQSAA
jgi:hypothetical protein